MQVAGSLMVPGTGLEPVSHAAADFKSAVYTNFTIRASRGFSHSHGTLHSPARTRSDVQRACQADTRPQMLRC